MDKQFFLIAAIAIAVIFIGLLIGFIISAKRTIDRNNATEKTRAMIFNAQIEDRKREIEAAQKMEDFTNKPSITDYVEKRPVYSSEPIPKQKQEPIQEEPSTNRKLGDFFKQN